jgi:hypothetical protein
MISCFFHNRAIRRHLDDGEPLSQSARDHINDCASCREFLAMHSAVVKSLTALPVEEIEAPRFLHARVMNKLRETPTTASRNHKWQWAVATSAVALLTISIAVLPPKRSTEPAPSWPELESPIALKTALPENPLESEIKNLRADTLNAAKALAANFLPAAEDSK